MKFSGWIFWDKEDASSFLGKDRVHNPDSVCSDITCLSGLSLNWANEIRYLDIFIVKIEIL